MKSNVSVTIDQADVGYIVRAGCITLVFENSNALVAELSRWLADPQSVEKEYIAKQRKRERQWEVDPPASEAIAGLSRSSYRGESPVDQCDTATGGRAETPRYPPPFVPGPGR